MSLQFGEIDCRAVLSPSEPGRGHDFVSDECCPDGSAAGEFSLMFQ